MGQVCSLCLRSSTLENPFDHEYETIDDEEFENLLGNELGPEFEDEYAYERSWEQKPRVLTSKEIQIMSEKKMREFFSDGRKDAEAERRFEDEEERLCLKEEWKYEQARKRAQEQKKNLAHVVDANPAQAGPPGGRVSSSQGSIFGISDNNNDDDDDSLQSQTQFEAFLDGVWDHTKVPASSMNSFYEPIASNNLASFPVVMHPQAARVPNGKLPPDQEVESQMDTETLRRILAGKRTVPLPSTTMTTTSTTLAGSPFEQRQALQPRPVAHANSSAHPKHQAGLASATPPVSVQSLLEGDSCPISPCLQIDEAHVKKLPEIHANSVASRLQSGGVETLEHELMSPQLADQKSAAAGAATSISFDL